MDIQELLDQGIDPLNLVSALSGLAGLSDRRMRLFAVSLYRTFVSCYDDAESQATLALVEGFAEGLVSEDVIERKFHSLIHNDDGLIMLLLPGYSGRDLLMAATNWVMMCESKLSRVPDRKKHWAMMNEFACDVLVPEGKWKAADWQSFAS